MRIVTSPSIQTQVVCGAEYCLAVVTRDDCDDSNASSSANNGNDESTAVYSWGWGDFGRLGHGHPNDVFIPQFVKGLAGVNVKSIACGDCHTLALSSDGKIFAFGRNQDGQLGLGKSEDCLLPQKVKSPCCPKYLVDKLIVVINKLVNGGQPSCS